MLAALVTASAGTASGVEIIPRSVSRSPRIRTRATPRFRGLALRLAAPFLKLEGGIGYRQDSFADGAVTVRQWPVTVSAWALPLPMVYAGGGLGWYRTTLDYRSSLPFKDSTTDKVGVHLGGGVTVPVASKLALDFNGRYIFMQKDNDNVQVPTTFNPGFWSLTLGLAISL
jgi:hypothetical protein